MSLAAALLLAAALPARAARTLPPAPPSYVYDEGVLSPAGRARLSVELSSFESRTGHQLVVAAFRSLEGESLEDYVNRLFRAWKIGDAKRNDGALFALFRDDRRWRVEVGYGLEPVVTDLDAARIAEDYGVPAFRAGDFDGGVLSVVQALEAVIEGGAPPAAPRRSPSRGGGDAAQTVLFLIIIVLWLMLRTRFFFLLPVLRGGRDDDFWGGGGWGGGGGGGGFSGGGGSSGGGGASGSW